MGFVVGVRSRGRGMEALEDWDAEFGGWTMWASGGGAMALLCCA